jgi:hypothetical protein
VFEAFVEADPGAGATCCGCCDGIKACGIIIKGWLPVGIMGVPGAPAFAPPGGIIMGTIIIICGFG